MFTEEEKKRFTEIEQEIKKETKKILQKKEKDYIFLPQLNKTLAQDFVNDFIKSIQGSEKLFYRKADDNIVEFVHNKIRIVNPSRMITIIEEYGKPSIFYMTKKEKEIIIKKSATESHCKIILQNPYVKKELNQIEHITKTPIPILKNGKLFIPKRGYNKELELYMDSEAPEIEEGISLNQAKKSIKSLYDEFCFKEPEDTMKAIMGLLTPFCRGLFEEWNTRTPVFVSYANRERAGKDYLAGIRSILIDGDAVEHPPISVEGRNDNSNEELRKKIMGAFMEGKKILHFANNKGVINNSVLEQVTTARRFEDRVLGTTKLASFENDLEFSLSGNMGCKMTADLANRSIIMHLHLVEENANMREFDKPNLHEIVRKERDFYLGCLFALVKNWYDLGMPKSEVKFASFPEWAAVVGGIVEAAGWENPNKKISVALADLDPDTEEMKQSFEDAYSRYPDQWIEKKDFKALMRECGLFTHFDVNDSGDQTKLSILIDKFVDRELGGILMSDDGNKRKARRKLRFSKSVIGTPGTFGRDFPKGNICLDNNEYILGIGKSVPSVPGVPKSSEEFVDNHIPCVVCDLKVTHGVDNRGRPICELCGNDPNWKGGFLPN